MTQTCFYHPSNVAATSCIQCGVPVCQECAQNAAGRPACPKCADTVRARFANSPAAPPPAVGRPAQGYGQPQGFSAPPPGYSPQPPNLPQAYTPGMPHYAAGAVAAGSDSRALLLGILASLAISIVGSIIIMKILFYAGVGLSLLYIALGYGVGYGLHKFTGTGAGMMPGIACLIMLAGLAVGHLVYVGDAIHSAGAGVSVNFMDAIPVVMRSFSPMHWICLFIGVIACWRGVERQG